MPRGRNKKIGSGRRKGRITLLPIPLHIYLLAGGFLEAGSHQCHYDEG
jgi:hypothetical protein